jgi:hypothetical protein
LNSKHPPMLLFLFVFLLLLLLLLPYRSNKKHSAVTERSSSPQKPRLWRRSGSRLFKKSPYDLLPPPPLLRLRLLPPPPPPIFLLRRRLLLLYLYLYLSVSLCFSISLSISLSLPLCMSPSSSPLLSFSYPSFRPLVANVTTVDLPSLLQFLAAVTCFASRLCSAVEIKPTSASVPNLAGLRATAPAVYHDIAKDAESTCALDLDQVNLNTSLPPGLDPGVERSPRSVPSTEESVPSRSMDSSGRRTPTLRKAKGGSNILDQLRSQSSSRSRRSPRGSPRNSPRQSPRGECASAVAAVDLELPQSTSLDDVSSAGSTPVFDGSGDLRSTAGV